MRAVGTDGESALADAFAHKYRYATRLTCFIHVHRNIKKQLQNRRFSEAMIKEILDDVLGCQHGDVLSVGLVDSASEAEFDKNLEIIKG